MNSFAQLKRKVISTQPAKENKVVYFFSAIGDGTHSKHSVTESALVCWICRGRGGASVGVRLWKTELNLRCCSSGVGPGVCALDPTSGIPLPPLPK